MSLSGFPILSPDIYFNNAVIYPTDELLMPLIIDVKQQQIAVLRRSLPVARD